MQVQNIVHSIDSTSGTLGFEYAEMSMFCMLLAFIHCPWFASKAAPVPKDDAAQQLGVS
jgi:hypothetical protein